MMLPAIRLAMSALLSAALMFAAQAAPPHMQPTSVELNATPGEPQRQILTVTNPGERERSLTIGLADWSLDRDGTLQLSPPGRRGKPATDWVRFTPSYITLPPGESRQIVVDILAPPDSVPAGDSLFAVIASAIEPDRKTGLMQKTELSSLFYVTAAPAVSAPVVSDARLIRNTGESAALELDLSNSGNAHARLEGEIIIKADAGTLVTLPVSNLVILEGQQRRFSIPVKQDIPAEARVTIRLDNIFAPQAEGGAAPLREFSAPLTATAAN